jgi:hypothetical protein
MTPVEPTPDPASFPAGEKKTQKFAWQPFTPRGVAALAQATFGRLFLVELFVALLAAAAVIWFLASVCFPSVRRAIAGLSEQGTIRNGQLVSPRTSPAPLVEGRIVAIAVDVENQGSTTPSSDVVIKFRKNDVQICSLFGCLPFPYSRNYIIDFNRPELEPWWGAWESIILGIVAIAVVAALLISWAALATLYVIFVRLIAFFNDRNASWGASWRLASAALMPGAVLLSSAIVLYGLALLDLIRFLVLAVLHLAVGWVYIILGTRMLPPVCGTTVRDNPFAAPPETKGDN